MKGYISAARVDEAREAVREAKADQEDAGAMLRAAEDRLGWSERMRDKGYVSAAKLEEAREAVRRAKLHSGK